MQFQIKRYVVEIKQTFPNSMLWLHSCKFFLATAHFHRMAVLMLFVLPSTILTKWIPLVLKWTSKMKQPETNERTQRKLGGKHQRHLYLRGFKRYVVEIKQTFPNSMLWLHSCKFFLATAHFHRMAVLMLFVLPSTILTKWIPLVLKWTSKMKQPETNERTQRKLGGKHQRPQWPWLSLTRTILQPDRWGVKFDQHLPDRTCTR